MEEFEAIVQQQRDALKRVHRLVDNLKKKGKENLTATHFDAALDLLEDKKKLFTSNHSHLLGKRTKTSAAHVYFTEDLCDQFESDYLDIRSEIITIRDNLNPEGSLQLAPSTNDNRYISGPAHSLPKITLPKFSGDYQTWIPFRDMFQSMVGAHENIPAVEKLHHLKGSLNGEAAQLIANMTVTADNFQPAWDTLVTNYEHKRAIVNAHLDRLLSINSISRRSVGDLKTLLSTVTETLGGLEALSTSVPANELLLVRFLTRLLDPETREAWELSQSSTSEPASFREFENFLRGRVRALDWISPSTTSKPVKATRGSTIKPTYRVHSACSDRSKCAHCNGSHFIAYCSTFSAKPVAERRAVVNSKRLCFNCMGNHRLTECKSKHRCRQCGDQHHSLLHRAATPVSVMDPPNTGTAASGSTTFGSFAATANHAASSFSASNEHLTEPSVTLLATVRVRILDHFNQQVEARALLDLGSELSFVRESFAQRLKLPRNKARVPIIGIGSQPSCTTRGVMKLELQSRFEPKTQLNAAFYVLPRLTKRVPAQEVDSTTWTHIHGLPLADPTFCKPDQIDVILGAEACSHLLNESIRRGAPYHPIAQQTTLGWVVFGPSGERFTSSRVNPSSAHGLHGVPPQDLNALLHQFWSQEEVPAVSSVILTEEEARCETHFVQTHSRLPSGRYSVRLPFRSSAPSLGRSRLLAERALQQMQNRFVANPQLGQLYSDFIQEYEALGHMAKATRPARNPSAVFFLPHHGVLRPDHTTTKLRVVFNGSAPSSTGKSLNDCLLTGPKLQQELADVLLRWRQYQFVFLADIEKMYRQIEIQTEDRDYQRILWSRQGSPAEYQLCTVTYGLSCAPYLALRVLMQLASDEGHRFPLAAPILQSEMYVDDVLSGADSLISAQSKAEQLRSLLKAGGFRLHKWKTNHPAVLNRIEDESPDSRITRDFNTNSLPRALGLAWDPNKDSFVFQIKPTRPAKSITKRVLLSRIAQLYDPLGWIAPVVIVAKIYLQELWLLKVDWDQPLSSTWVQRWMAFEEGLTTISSLSLPRWIGIHPAFRIELHGFCDASTSALGAVFYLRSISSAGVKVSLIMGKSRVAPLKRQTIPRLELSAAVLLARLLSRILEVLKLEQVPVHLWTDSSVVLAWIHGHPSRWKDFVANRVVAIQDLATNAQWHHVSGEENPADCASRGLMANEFLTHPLWWIGPPWLSNPPESWNTTAPPPDCTVDMEERPQQIYTAVTDQPICIWDMVKRYSQLKRLLRITAWLFRATSRLKGRKNDAGGRVLVPDEIAAAEAFWVLQTQRAYFVSVIKIISQGSQLPLSHPMSRLTPFLDQDGILRLGGRLHNSQLDPDAKHPILMPRDSAITHLLIDDAHRRTMHGGTQLVLSTLRQRFWILGGRTPIRTFIRNCTRCHRYRATAAQQLMGQLPLSRITPSRPFLHTGVDYAGPYLLKSWPGRCNRLYKAFLVIFVCMATSAVHLEVATSYSTAGFMTAYKRFCARRGICASLKSDCGTNLVGADAELRRLFSSTTKEMGDLANLMASDGTEWSFNPPAAPHFGGKWEAAVKSTKHHLRRIVGDTSLTYEELATVLAQIEAVLNSRPLCALSDDPADVSALTPAHFLTGEPLSLIPEPSVIDVPVGRLSRLQHLRQMVERFWHRWSTEYLQRLQSVPKWHHRTKTIGIGNLVLVRDERYPPAKWPLGRIIETHAGADGLIRVATVRTATTVLKRPIVKLCPLPPAT